jgi:hypothetical protein
MSSRGINKGRTPLVFSTPILSVFSYYNIVLFLFNSCNKILLDFCLHMLCLLILRCGFKTRSTCVLILVLENLIDFVIFMPIIITCIICMRCKEHNFKHHPNMYRLFYIQVEYLGHMIYLGGLWV